MSYDVVLESVEPGFHGPVVAALLTASIPSRTVWRESGGFRNATTVGLGLNPAKAERRATSCPSVVARGVTLEDAEHLKAYLQAGHFPEKAEWPRPEPGRACCVVAIRPAEEKA
ncbi:hypothetical protein OJF2_01980 [Aquisphaera giovannonii]|uniref:Uncharacterized protein n=1 Tax=Aquisphaera giovannonii TaxID=406548 RepID=A0A5B9VTP7_9BACT|nr:hypothetical protein [Aquisphaera giovannonii]QEH31733.1 hypothetical protein OJF2_01980 [Aquisphaera giovannonii]